ncbi:hypothetical protein Sru01_58300 [Sphaerisporangium rufum]|uniref:DUF2231 domain-containing protein n=1 Tax=Sphaerisporangium rufum TaxID=1381558 RepID=A0A919V467_9ACTN|nr:DUF2231 domain-containing protein [Sphaerisporangium rufum]GII80848.1 hypothetical protein Sru01_58300 [Sphaerisporangium rufum]
MFEEILGLPAHPLIIHTAVMLVPMLVLASVAFGAVPRLRPFVEWLVVVLAIAAPAAAFAARESGEALEERLYSGGLPDNALGRAVTLHESYATPTMFSAIGLGVASLLLVYSARRLGRITTVTLTVLVVVLAAVAGYYIFRAGHTGAEAVWSH